MLYLEARRAGWFSARAGTSSPRATATHPGQTSLVNTTTNYCPARPSLQFSIPVSSSPRLSHLPSPFLIPHYTVQSCSVPTARLGPLAFERNRRRSRCGSCLQAGTAIHLVISRPRRRPLQRHSQPPKRTFASSTALCDACRPDLLLRFAGYSLARHELLLIRATDQTRPPGDVSLTAAPDLDSLQWLFHLLIRFESIPSQPVQHTLQQCLRRLSRTRPRSPSGPQRGGGPLADTHRELLWLARSRSRKRIHEHAKSAAAAATGSPGLTRARTASPYPYDWEPYACPLS